MASSPSVAWSFDGTYVDGLRSPIPVRQKGSTYTATLEFRDSGQATGYKTRYQNVLDYINFAGAVEVGRTDSGDVWVDESNLSPSAPVSSLIVPLEPQTVDSNNLYEGIWGVVTGGSSDNRIHTPLVLDVDLYYLADRSDHADRSAVETAYATSPV